MPFINCTLKFKMSAFNIVMTPNAIPRILGHAQLIRNYESQPVIQIQIHLRLCNLL